MFYFFFHTLLKKSMKHGNFLSPNRTILLGLFNTPIISCLNSNFQLGLNLDLKSNKDWAIILTIFWTWICDYPKISCRAFGLFRSNMWKYMALVQMKWIQSQYLLPKKWIWNQKVGRYLLYYLYLRISKGRY